MKKIVGIIAAAAILATSVFAADVSATAKVSSNLFTSADGAMTLFETLNNAQTADYATLFSLQVSTDNAGGGVKYWGGKGVNIDMSKLLEPDYEPGVSDLVAFGAYNVWFKPTDNLKLSFRENGGGLFGDKYHGYYANNVAGYGAGYGASISLDALAIDICFKEGFMSKAKDQDAVIGQLGAKIGYNADFGSIAAIFSADKNFKAFEIGAGYQGSFDVVGVVFNVGAKIADSKTTIGINPSAGGNIDAISWAIDVPVTIADDTSVGLNAKAGYALDNVKFTFRFEDSNLMAKEFDATIGLAIEGNVGIAAWKVDPNFGVKAKKFAVGFEAGVNF